MDKKDFKGKVVLITGAGKGSGRKLAEAFARHGATVAANDISPNNVEEVVAKINAGGGSSRAYVEDVAKKVGAQALVKQVEDDFGCIDILVNHAAVEPRSPLLDMDEWDWHRVLDVNLTGAFLMTQSVGRVMRAGAGGVIINIVSEAGRDGSTRRAAFFASMAGLESFSQQAASELAPYGIKVHVVKTDTDSETILDLCRELSMNQLFEYRSKLIDRIEASAEEFRAACLAVRDPFKAVDEGGWNTHQVAVHTRDVDRLVYGLRVRRTAEEDKPVFQNFDGDAWMAENYNPEEPLASILDELSASVKGTVSLLRELPPEDWSRPSGHEIYGDGFTLQTWVERGLEHIQEHLDTLKKAA